MQKVSIVISTRNRADVLPRAIDSVLRQSYKNIEIIIADDESSDDTRNVAMKFVEKDNRIKYFRQEERIGIAATWKKAFFEYSTGDLITVLNDDDEFVDDCFIEKATRLFDKYKKYNAACVFSKVLYKNTEGDHIYGDDYLFGEIIDGRDIFMNQFLYSDNGALYKREAVSKLDLFSKDITTLDTEMMFKLALYGNFIYLDSITYQHNVEPGCVSYFSQENIVKNFDAIQWIPIVADFAKRNGLLADEELHAWKHKHYSYEANRISWMYRDIASDHGEFLNRCHELISEDEKVAVYGTKEAAKILYNSFEKYGIENQIVCFVDDFEDGELFGKNIVRPIDIINDITVIIPSGSAETIRNIYSKIGNFNFSRVIDLFEWRRYLEGQR